MRRVHHSVITTVGAAMMLAVVSSAQAAIVLTNDWQSSAEGWLKADSFGSPGTILTEQASLGGETALKIVGGDAVDSESYIYSTTLAGNKDYTTLGLAGAKSFNFDFYAESATPGALEVYFYNGNADTRWFYTIDSSDLAVGWSTYQVNFWTSEGWYNPDYGPGTQAKLDADLADVDEIGLLLLYLPTGAGQVYGTDDWQINDEYYVPEPGTYAMLGFVFLSLAVTFRKNLNEQIERALAVVRLTRQS